MNPVSRRRARRAASLCVIVVVLASCNAVKEVAGTVLGAVANNYLPGTGNLVRQMFMAMTGGARPVATIAAADAAADAAQDAGSDAAPDARLDVSLNRIRTAGGEREPIADGDVLRDGGEDLRGGDKFSIAFRASEARHLYIIGVDATGWVDPLFPSAVASFGNPIEANRDYEIPEGDLAFGLDTYRGIQHVYFIASREPRPDIESLMDSFRDMERPVPRSEVRVSEPAIVQRGVERQERGRELRVTTRGGEQAITPDSFFADGSGDDIVVTRWFRHEGPLAPTG